MADKYIRFVELLEGYLVKVLQKKFGKVTLTNEMLREMRDEIRTRVDGVFDKSSFKLTPEARGWVSNQFFKTIKVSEDQIINDVVVINEYKLSAMPYSDIELLKNLFNETIMGQELLEEYKLRSKG